MQGGIKFFAVYIFHVLHEVRCPIKKCDIIPAVILRVVFPQIVFCYSCEFCLAVDCAFLVADVVAERNLSLVFLPDFRLRGLSEGQVSLAMDNASKLAYAESVVCLTAAKRGKGQQAALATLKRSPASLCEHLRSDKSQSAAFICPQSLLVRPTTLSAECRCCAWLMSRNRQAHVSP